jgi:protein-S-isoprenylcysteine O-methyltransferase Ste14
MIKLIAKFGGILILIAIGILFLRGSVLSSSPWAIAFQLLAIGLVIWARATFLGQQFKVTADPGSGQLLQRGPYRFIRHPMYLAALLFVWASILSHWSLTNLFIGFLVVIILIIRIHVEEGLLREKYPEYQEYARKTKRFIPFIW